MFLNKDGGEPGDGKPALWLYAKQGAPSGGPQLLLLETDTFSSSRSLKIQLEGKDYLLIPVGLQEKGLDFDLAKFKIIEQETDS